MHAFTAVQGWRNLFITGQGKLNSELYSHLGLGSASALGDNKDILLVVRFNYNITLT